MQYKTVTIEHPCNISKGSLPQINDEYERIINEYASQGWKLLGIHPIKVRRWVGFLQFILIGFIMGRHKYYQADVIIFFKE